LVSCTENRKKSIDELCFIIDKKIIFVQNLHWKKCAMRCCSCVTDLLLLGKTTNYCSCTDQLLRMHRPTIAHALTEQLLVGYRPTIDHIMGYNAASRKTYYCSYIWPSTGRIIFWVYICIDIIREIILDSRKFLRLDCSLLKVGFQTAFCNIFQFFLNLFTGNFLMIKFNKDKNLVTQD
jgi:hypothetical protein